MFRVKVNGLYIARSPNSEKEKIKKPYQIEGNIPSLNSALSVVKNKLLAPALAAKYPDYVHYLTHHIVEVTPLDLSASEEMTRAEVQFMDRATLIRFIKESALPVDASFFPELQLLREAVQEAKEDPEGFQKRFALKKDDLILSAQIAAANPELFGQAASNTPASVLQAGQGAPKAKRTPETLAKNTGDRLKGLTAEMTREGEMGPMDVPQDQPDDL
jgi:hypothetical protein